MPRFAARLCSIALCLTVSFAAAGAAAVRQHPAAALIERGTTAMRIDPEASRRDAEAALALLAAEPDADLQIRAYLLLCDYLSERDRASAERQIARATPLLPQARRKGLRAGLLNCEGEIHETAGDNERARQFYEQAVAIAGQAKDDEMLAGALFSRGYLQGLHGDYAAGLTDLRRSQTLYEQIDMPHHALTAMNGVAILYNRMGDYTQARYIYTRTLKAQRDAGMLREQAVTLHNLARAHENLQEWDAAHAAFLEAVQISRQLAYPRGEAYALRGLAAVSNARGDPRAALTTLDEASALQRQTPDARLNAQILLARGMALRQLDRHREGADALEQALKIFQDADALVELGATYAELAVLNSAMGNWRAAFDYQTQSQSTAGRMYRNQLDQRFATLKIEFDTAAKEKENTLLVRENDANQKALAQERKARSLQAVVIALIVVLAVLLATLALHQRRSSLRMRTLALTDELTGVPNRRAVLGRLERLLRSEPATCSLMIVDIDHFKSINDRHGHPAGDEVLKLVAAQLQRSIREPSFLGRLGGEEFVLVLPGAQLESAGAFADQLREAISAIDVTRWLIERRITVSIGVTASVGPTDSSSSMLQRADTALYAAKHAGRNCVRAEAPTTPPGTPQADPASLPLGAVVSP